MTISYSPFDWLGYPRYDPDREREPPPEPVAVEIDESILETYPGTYELGGGKFLYVQFADGALRASTDLRDWSVLLAESQTRFFIEGEDLRLEFVTDETGNVTEVILLVEGARLRLPRTN